jgi:hypothetical protein
MGQRQYQVADLSSANGGDFPSTAVNARPIDTASIFEKMCHPLCCHCISIELIVYLLRRVARR